MVKVRQLERVCRRKIGAADRGKPTARDRTGVRGIRRCARSCSLGRVLKWRFSSLMITSNNWIQDSFWLLLPADLIVSQNRTIKPFFSQKKEIGHCGEAVFQTTQCGLRGTCTVMLFFFESFMSFSTLSSRICVNEPIRRTWKHSHTKSGKIEPGGFCNSSSVTWKFAVGIQCWHVLHG